MPIIKAFVVRHVPINVRLSLVSAPCQTRRKTVHQPCLFIGGNDDSLTNPAPDGVDSLRWPVGTAGKRETYNRLALSLGDASVSVFVRESLTLEQALNLLVEHYKAWCVRRPGGRH
jgi:hypothetical protein